MVLRTRPTPTRLPTNSLHTPPPVGQVCCLNPKFPQPCPRAVACPNRAARVHTRAVMFAGRPFRSNALFNQLADGL